MKIILLAVVLTITVISIGFSQTCKRNVIDCTGLCGRFTDNNSDGFCDFSPRSTKVDTAKKVNPTVSADTAKRKIVPSTGKTNPKPKQDTYTKKIQKTAEKTPDNKKPQVNTINQKTRDTSMAVNEAADSGKTIESASNVAALEQKADTPKEKPYALIKIGCLTLGLYLFTFLLVITNVIKKVTHRKIWNALLLITFLMSGLLGLFLVIQLNYEIAESWYFDFLKLHVEFGISMAVISIIHIIWHWTYYLNLVRKNK